MKNREIVEEWLTWARSNLSRARAGRVFEEILYEDLCFDCQQTVEKTLKGVISQLKDALISMETYPMPLLLFYYYT